MTTDPPGGLHNLEYARGLLENVLAWPPVKGNLELIAECIGALCKAKRFTGPQAYSYLHRAITLAKEQGIPVDHFFFAHGKYTDVRPQKANLGLPLYKRIDWDEVAKEQSTPEWQAANAELRAVLAKWQARQQCHDENSRQFGQATLGRGVLVYLPLEPAEAHTVPRIENRKTASPWCMALRCQRLRPFH